MAEDAGHARLHSTPHTRMHTHNLALPPPFFRSSVPSGPRLSGSRACWPASTSTTRAPSSSPPLAPPRINTRTMPSVQCCARYRSRSPPVPHLPPPSLYFAVRAVPFALQLSFRPDHRTLPPSLTPPLPPTPHPQPLAPSHPQASPPSPAPFSRIGLCRAGQHGPRRSCRCDHRHCLRRLRRQRGARGVYFLWRDSQHGGQADDQRQQ